MRAFTDFPEHVDIMLVFCTPPFCICFHESKCLFYNSDVRLSTDLNQNHVPSIFLIMEKKIFKTKKKKEKKEDVNNVCAIRKDWFRCSLCTCLVHPSQFLVGYSEYER